MVVKHLIIKWQVKSLNHIACDLHLYMVWEGLLHPYIFYRIYKRFLSSCKDETPCEI